MSFVHFSQDVIWEIPKKDSVELEIFFRDLIFDHQFGYTLFGDKPISIKGYFVKRPLRNMLAGIKEDKTKKRWHIWKQYSHWFPIKNYILLEEEAQFPIRVITLINKRAFVREVNKHLDLFREILGKNITGGKLLNKVDREGANLFKILKRDESLYGILLGYGRKNAIAYKRYMELIYYHCPLNRKEFVPRWPRPSKGFESSEEEYSWLKNQLQPLPQQMLFHEHQKFISMISPVMFLSKKGDVETLALYKKYKEQQRFLTQLYSKGNILEITLKKLSS